MVDTYNDDEYVRRIEEVENRFVMGPMAELWTEVRQRERELDARFPHSFLRGVATDPEHIRLRRALWEEFKVRHKPLHDALVTELGKLEDEWPGHPYWEHYGEGL